MPAGITHPTFLVSCEDSARSAQPKLKVAVTTDLVTVLKREVRRIKRLLKSLKQKWPSW